MLRVTYISLFINFEFGGFFSRHVDRDSGRTVSAGEGDIDVIELSRFILRYRDVMGEFIFHNYKSYPISTLSLDRKSIVPLNFFFSFSAAQSNRCS